MRTRAAPASGTAHEISTILHKRRRSFRALLMRCPLAGRFAQMAADLGARVAGIDAAEELVEIAVERTPDGDFRVGDLEALPWPEDSCLHNECDGRGEGWSSRTTFLSGSAVRLRVGSRKSYHTLSAPKSSP